LKRIILKPWQRIVLHVIFPAALTLVLFAGSLFFYTLPRFRETIREENKQFLREMINIVYALAENYQARVDSGELTVSEAQQRFVARLRTIRYGRDGQDYFWINDLESRLIMHPYRPDLEGKDLHNWQDPAGSYIFRDFADVAQKHGSGYVEYMWQWQNDPERVLPKISYVRLFEPWQWVFGTGIYVEDMQQEIDTLTWDVHRNTAAIFLVVACLCGYLSWHGVQTEMHRRQAEQDLTESYERFKTVLDSLDAIVYVTNIQTHEVLFVNKCGLDMAPETKTESGRHCWQGLLSSDREVPCASCELLQLIRSGRQSGVHVREIHHASSGRWYECRDQLIRWVDGSPVCLEIAADITQRKLAEREREGLMRKLSFKNDELQSIVYAASHDLRSPLINIQGFSKELGHSCGRLSELLQRFEGAVNNQSIVQTILEEDIPESLDFIYRNTEKMQTLVNGLLQLSRIGTAKLNMQTLDMNALVNDVIAANNYQIKSIGAEITVESLPQGYGDYNQINQVFSNLIDNSLKYRQQDRPLKIHISGQVADNGVTFAVADNGIGIPEIHLNRIFELFQQLRPAAGASEGVGLGLTIVKRIMDIHNGQIRVESEPDAGSTFFITLPKA
jgi:signal transduction histidine kinase